MSGLFFDLRNVTTASYLVPANGTFETDLTEPCVSNPGKSFRGDLAFRTHRGDVQVFSLRASNRICNALGLTTVASTCLAVALLSRFQEASPCPLSLPRVSFPVQNDAVDRGRQGDPFALLLVFFELLFLVVEFIAFSTDFDLSSASG